ncbi:MAG: HEPN domain-containing protein [Puniceicoccaceae bacterium]|nr:MAG: HEPN domain-containing protein [Puniceicoccaceae bacterium]
MSNRAQDWLDQAKDDLRWGVASAESGFYSQTCFIAQQVAEKSLKALAYSRGAALVRGHSVFLVCRELEINGELEEAAQRLDQYYIPTRYPDAQPAGAPFRFFTAKQAKEALEFAEKFIEKAQSEIQERGP